jgi:ankyrin repeat protein
VIDLLLDLKADINKIDNDGNSPLHYAVNSNCQRTIKKLLIRGANKKIKNLEGKTAYDLAKDTNHSGVAGLLEIKSFYKKYICMENELTEFKKTRNDRLLYSVIIFVLVSKVIYIIKFSNTNINKLYCSCKYILIQLELAI